MLTPLSRSLPLTRGDRSRSRLSRPTGTIRSLSAPSAKSSHSLRPNPTRHRLHQQQQRQRPTFPARSAPAAALGQQPTHPTSTASPRQPLPPNPSQPHKQRVPPPATRPSCSNAATRSSARASNACRRARRRRVGRRRRRAAGLEEGPSSALTARWSVSRARAGWDCEGGGDCPREVFWRLIGAGFFLSLSVNRAGDARRQGARSPLLILSSKKRRPPRACAIHTPLSTYPLHSLLLAACTRLVARRYSCHRLSSNGRSKRPVHPAAIIRL